MDENEPVTPGGIRLDPASLSWRFSRASGAGGQHVNTTSSRAELRCDLDAAGLVNAKGPTAQRMLKFSFNLIDDGLVGQQVFAGEATRLAYGTDEAQEGRDSFLEKRDPDFSPYPYHY